MSQDYKPLECQMCDNKHGLEFSCTESDEPKSLILCGTCSGEQKAYIIRRGYQIYYDNLFGPPHCQNCEDNDNLKELRIPQDIKSEAARHVICLECIKEQEEE